MGGWVGGSTLVLGAMSLSSVCNKKRACQRVEDELFTKTDSKPKLRTCYMLFCSFTLHPPQVDAAKALLTFIYTDVLPLSAVANPQLLRSLAHTARSLRMVTLTLTLTLTRSCCYP